jgi:3-deoxy-D-manno-octulosonic-acid transferase
MRHLYSLLLTLLAALLLPYFLWQGLRRGKYLGQWPARLGWGGGALDGGSPLEGESGPVIWLHAVSVGETLAARPLCRALKSRYPEGKIFLTTTTATGQAVAQAQVPEADMIGYYPFDWAFAVRRVLDRVKPELVILMESELWLNFLSECRRREIPVVVANGRISDRSFPRARRVRFLVRRLYGLVTRFVMQSEVDAARAVALGADPARVIVAGNLKYDVGLGGGAVDEARLAALESLCGGRATPLIVAGSTHPGEEAIVLAAWQRLRVREGMAGGRLLIAPRHPERFNEVAELIGAAGLTMVRRSQAAAGVAGEVILLDSIGELALVYELATLVLVGGSLRPIGGHNILEPALAGRPIVVGPYMHNFREMTAGFLRADALIQIGGEDDEVLTARLAEVWASLLADPAAAAAMGERARQTVEANRGATARTVAMIAALIEAR